MRVETIGDCTLYLGDCRDVLAEIGPVDAVVTDPPYGIGENHRKVASRENAAKTKDYGAFDWDKQPCSPEQIAAIRAASRWQIIFGGNYFELPPTSCWLVWDKQNSGDFADCELAWTNLPKAVRRIYWRWNGMIRKGHEERLHPTQKPLGVMEWCLQHLPESTVTICDPFMGSGTTGVACAKAGKRFVGIERDPTYFDIACRRIEDAYKQPDMFVIKSAQKNNTTRSFFLRYDATPCALYGLSLRVGDGWSILKSERRTPTKVCASLTNMRSIFGAIAVADSVIARRNHIFNASTEDVRQRRPSNNIDCNSLRLIPHEQLAILAKHVKAEVRRRSQERATRDAFRGAVFGVGEDFNDWLFSKEESKEEKEKKSNFPKAIPDGAMHDNPRTRLRYLKTLLNQDWSFLWRTWEHLDQTKKYCVYAHVDPKEKVVCVPSRFGGKFRMPFYIGKGTISRAHDLKRNQGHGIKIRQVLSGGSKPEDIVHIIQSDLTESEALELEAKFIYFFGTIYESGINGCLLNLDTSLRPDFVGVIKLSGNDERQSKRARISGEDAT